MRVDFGKTASDYVRYRVGFPDELYSRLLARGVGERGQRVLDLGTGTGTLARGFASRGCEVVGLDVAEALVSEARKLDGDAGVRIDYVVAPAEKTGLPAHSFDVVIAGQAWNWFDRNKAIKEVRRTAKPGGWFVLAHFDALPLPKNVVEASEELIQTYNPEWDPGPTTGLHPDWLDDVRRAGFIDVETFSIDLSVSYSHEAWRGRVRASAGVLGSLSSDTVARFDEKLGSTLVDRFPEEPLRVPHCLWALSCRVPRQSS
jgi:SAM-dependent methyltransferase